MENQFRKLSPAGELRYFYVDRFLRVYPLFAVVLLLTAAISHYSASALVWNALLFPLDYTSFTTVPLIIGPSWSLACECQYYLVVPLLSLASTRTLRGLTLASSALFAVSPFLPASTFWAYGSLPGILFSFVSGMLLWRGDRRFLRWVWLLFAVLLALFLGSKLGHFRLPTGIHVNVCIGYLAALPLLSWLSTLSPKVKLDQRLGLLSYPLFLVHEFVQQAMPSFFSRFPGTLLLPSSILVAGLLVYLVERPLDKLRYLVRRPISSAA